MRYTLPLLAAALLPVIGTAAPVANPDTVTASEDAEFNSTISVLDNDTSDGPDLTAAVIDPPLNGYLNLASNGTFTYLPNAQFHGTDQFTYIAQETDDRPVAFVVDQSLSQVEFTATVNDPALGSRTDTDSSSITGTATTQLDPARAPLDDVQITDFAFTLADGANLTFSYGFAGSLNVHVDDDDLTIAMATPGPGDNIDAENKFSQPGNDVRITGTADITATGSLRLFIEDTTQDLDALETIDITDAVITETAGTLTLTIPITFISTIPIDDTRTVDVDLTGQIVATATVPPLPVDSAPTTVTINVAPTDDGPIANNDTFTTPVGQTLTRSAALGLIANDIDLDGDTLTATLFTPPASGTATVNPDGSFTYAPAPGFAGTATFTYSISDSNPPTTVPLLAPGSVWRYLDDGSDQGTAWRDPEFDDTTWASGPAELGYGDGQATTIGFGGDDQNRFITTYFRITFPVADPSALNVLNAGILRDDAAAVYVNGTEVYRDPGLAPDADSTTPATISAGGADESTFFPFTISPDLLVAGQNTIAVEVHQSSGTSSDVSFDLAIEATLPTLSPLVPASSSWTYLDDGSDQMTAWRAPAFDDSLWQSGPARLGYGEPEIVTTVDFGPDGGDKFRTTYFRHTFEVSDTSTVQAAQVRLLADDGAAVFLNDTEVARLRLDPDATFDTLATRTAGGIDEHRYIHFVIDPALLNTGTNTLAVEVHQGSNGSSDLGFDLELLASFAPALARVTIQVTGEPGADSDNDGMLDDYEIQFGLTVGIDDSALDPDADGQTNLQEFLAGTDPFDPASALAISTTTYDENTQTFSLTFQSVPGKTYHLQSSETLVTWQDVPGTTITANTSESTLTYTIPDDLKATSIRVVTP